MTPSTVLLLAVAVVALVVGVLLRARLARHDHRYDDERDLPPRSHAWVVPTLTVAAALLAVSLSTRWGVAVAIGYAALMVPLVAMAAIDLDVHRLPDRWTWPFAGAALLLVVVLGLLERDGGSILRAALAGVVTFVVYALLMVISPGGQGLGFGDVKLSLGLGILLGWFGWDDVLLGGLLGFLTGGLWAIGLLVTRRASRSSSIAFGPFMVLGAWLALLVA